MSISLCFLHIFFVVYSKLWGLDAFISLSFLSCPVNRGEINFKSRSKEVLVHQIHCTVSRRKNLVWYFVRCGLKTQLLQSRHRVPLLNRDHSKTSASRQKTLSNRTNNCYRVFKNILAVERVLHFSLYLTLLAASYIVPIKILFI